MVFNVKGLIQERLLYLVEKFRTLRVSFTESTRLAFPIHFQFSVVCLKHIYSNTVFKGSQQVPGTPGGPILVSGRGLAGPRAAVQLARSRRLCS